ncbi:hypothetical protein BYT27DRAFT_6629712 [Phlegmacium glaucopus]|nr:hypothetical protein BYT27DRAFT_6629712 [Phlegmacium glaucopus]
MTPTKRRLRMNLKWSKTMMRLRKYNRLKSILVIDTLHVLSLPAPSLNMYLAFPSQVRRSPARVEHRIEIPDPWAGLKIYAEDSYTGGDVRPSPGARCDPHHLGDDDSHEIEETSPDATYNKGNIDEMQIAEQDTSFPSHDEEQERPVDIPDPWVGPRTYAEDFYAGGDVRTHPGQEIDPSLLECTVRDDIGVPSASKIMTPYEQGYEEDQEQLEDEREHDEEAIIKPPTQHTFAPTSRLARRALPIPANAEFISILDSDQEAGEEVQEPIKLAPLEVVDVDFQELQHEDVDEQNMKREQSLEVDEIVEEDTAHMHKPIPPSDISMDQYESIYANIEAVAVQTEEQAGNLLALTYFASRRSFTCHSLEKKLFEKPLLARIALACLDEQIRLVTQALLDMPALFARLPP